MSGKPVVVAGFTAMAMGVKPPVMVRPYETDNNQEPVRTAVNRLQKMIVTYNEVATNTGGIHIHYLDFGEPQRKQELAMAYVVKQPEITQVYKAEDALKVGTLFPELNKPFVGNRGLRDG